MLERLLAASHTPARYMALPMPYIGLHSSQRAPTRAYSTLPLVLMRWLCGASSVLASVPALASVAAGAAVARVAAR